MEVIPLEINDVVIGELSKLFAYIDKSWEQNSNVRCEVFSDGITNKVVGCFSPNAKVKGAVVRIFGKCTEKFLDRDREYAVQIILNRANLAPPVFARFLNGVCYGFVNGKAVTLKSVRDYHMAELIAAKLATFHCLATNEFLSDEVSSSLASYDISPGSPCLWRKLEEFLSIAEKECSKTLMSDNRFLEVFHSFAHLRDQIDKTRNHIDEFVLPFKLRATFCHNDLLLNNILHDAEQDTVNFIDFEYADFNYAAFDIANHFVEFCGDTDMDFNRYPPKDFQLVWIKNYLSMRNSLMELDSPSETDINVWFVMVQKFSLAATLIWSMWALVQKQFSELEFDFFEFAVQRYSGYLKMKNEFMELSINANGAICNKNDSECVASSG